MSRQHNIDCVRNFLSNVEMWMRFDLHQNGPGPSGGFQSRHAQAKEALRIFTELYPNPSFAVDGGSLEAPEPAEPGEPKTKNVDLDRQG